MGQNLQVENPQIKKERDRAVLPIPVEMPLQSEEAQAIMLTGGRSWLNSVQEMATPKLNKLSPQESKAVQEVLKLLPKIAGADGVLNVNDVPGLINSLLKDPQVLEEIRLGIQRGVGQKKEQISENSFFGKLSKFPILNRAKDEVIDKVVDFYVKNNPDKVQSEGLRQGVAQISEQLNALFMLHGNSPIEVKVDQGPHSITKAEMLTLASSLKTLYNYQIEARRSLGLTIAISQDEYFREGISLEMFKPLTENPPKARTTADDVVNKYRVIKVGHVPQESPLSFATSYDLNRYGLNLSLRAESSFYIDRRTDFLIQREGKGESAKWSIYRGVKRQDPLSSENAEDNIYIQDAKLLELYHSGDPKKSSLNVKSDCVFCHNGVNYQNFSTSDSRTLQRNLTQGTLGVIRKDGSNLVDAASDTDVLNVLAWDRYDKWVNSQATKVENAKDLYFIPQQYKDTSKYDVYCFGNPSEPKSMPHKSFAVIDKQRGNIVHSDLNYEQLGVIERLIVK
ncbi:MAG: hypothetical protein KBC84_05845 [Proteobacteria bacterium]|nr:hypothetical protein [Pseudomonadota bacterium]